MHVLKAVSLAAVISAGTLLSGCATRESVEHAQSTADLADSNARGAKSAADRAQATADGANKTAQDAMTSAQAANDKVDKLISDMEKRKHTAARHHRRHHVASATQNGYATCPPQQKTELKKSKNQAALQPKSPLKTAQN